MADWITHEYRAGEKITIGEKTLIPFSHFWRIKFLGNQSGSVVWNRPSSVLVRSADGEEQVLPIYDLTRRVMISLFAACLGSLIIFGLISSIGRKSK
jgi:hypothetical protein